MKKAKVFFHPIDGSGSLTISWSSSPKGDAVEAKKGAGVGFFSDKGDLLCVIFDEVKSSHDHQTLEFDSYRIEITTKNEQVVFDLCQIAKTSLTTRKKRRRKRSSLSN